MMLRIILNTDMHLNVAFDRLKNKMGGIFVLITSKRAYHKIKEEQQVSYCDEIFFEDDFSVDRLADVIQQMQEKYGVSSSQTRITTLEEQCVVDIARVRERLSITGQDLENAMLFTNKWMMKQRLSQTASDVALPFYALLDKDMFSVPIGGDFPLFIKPINLGGAQKSYKVEDEKQFYEVWQHLDQAHEYEINTFIEGDVYHADSLVCQGEIKAFFVSGYMHPPYDVFKGKPCASRVLDPHKSGDIYQKAYQLNKRVLEGLGACSGVFHLEFFKRGDDYIFLEVGSRPAGGAVPRMLEKAYGVHLQEEHIMLQCMDGYVCASFVYRYSDAFWAYMPIRKGIVTKLHALEMVSSCEKRWRIAVGEVLEDPKSISDRALELLVYGDHQDVMHDFLYVRDHYKAYDVKKNGM